MSRCHFALVLLVALSGCYIPERIQAKGFFLVDDDGKFRGALTASEDGTFFVLARADEKPGIVMRTGNDSSPETSVMLFDKRHKIRVVLNLQDDMAAVAIFDEQGKTEKVLGVASTVVDEAETAARIEKVRKALESGDHLRVLREADRTKR